ncbi:hypothetical protein [Longispora albida]|uniref:hypothetical protein n=1 Tax=Longispora albida TaxID=203523 RepID=UPI0003734355|nr:hypothetical protein [Longispora albida]
MLTRAALTRRLNHLPVPLAVTGGALVLAAIIGLVLAGWAGAAGAALGVALVGVSYVVSSVVVAWADAVNPKLTMPAGLGVYAVKFGLLGSSLGAISATGWAGLKPMGFAVIGATLCWTFAHAVWLWKARLPYVEIEQR